LNLLSGIGVGGLRHRRVKQQAQAKDHKKDVHHSIPFQDWDTRIVVIVLLAVCKSVV
jgi:hypothetical protein